MWHYYHVLRINTIKSSLPYKMPDGVSSTAAQHIIHLSVQLSSAIQLLPSSTFAVACAQYCVNGCCAYNIADVLERMAEVQADNQKTQLDNVLAQVSRSV